MRQNTPAAVAVVAVALLVVVVGCTGPAGHPAPAPAPPEPSPRTVLLLSDTHYGDARHEYQSATRAATAWARSQRPDYVLHAGDVTEDGAPEQWRQARRDFEAITNASPAEQVWWTPGGSHDSFSGTPRSHAATSADHGLAALDWMPALGQSSLLYSVRVGNTVFVSVPTYHTVDRFGLSHTTYPEAWQWWLRQRLRTAQDADRNVVLWTHQPFTNTTSYTDPDMEWARMADPWWQQTSQQVRQLVEQYDVDVVVSGHVHTDPAAVVPADDAKSGKVVDGRRFPSLPDATFVSAPAVTYQHGRAAPNQSRFPAAYTWRFTPGERVAALRAYDVRNGTRVPISVGDAGQRRMVVPVRFDHRIRFGARSTRGPFIDDYTQGWLPSGAPDLTAPGRADWFTDGRWTVPGDDYWWRSRWQYPTREVVPAGVAVNASGLAAEQLTHEWRARADGGGWEPYGLGSGRPVDGLLVNTSAAEAGAGTVSAMQPRYALVAKYLDLRLANGTYRVADVQAGATLADARVDVRADAAVERVEGLTYRIGPGATGTIGAVNVAPASAVRVRPSQSPVGVADATLTAGEETAVAISVRDVAGGAYALYRDGQLEQVATATGGTVRFETTVTGQGRVVVRRCGYGCDQP